MLSETNIEVGSSFPSESLGSRPILQGGLLYRVKTTFPKLERISNSFQIVINLNS